MILPTFFLILFARLSESLNTGETCSLTSGGIGTCMSLYNCESVHEQLTAGVPPDTICGYEGHDQIICCPKDSIQTTTIRPSRTRRQLGNGGGEIAKAKCAYYSQFVFTLKVVSSFGDMRSLNVSQCAIRTPVLVGSLTIAKEKQFPYMAALGFDSEDGKIEWLCSGTLISETFVLTAAHCTHSVNHGEVKWARLGSLKLVDEADDKVGPVTRRIIERINHPDFKRPAHYNDIALLRLESEVTLNGWIRPACLYTRPSTDVTEVIGTAWDYLDWQRDDRSNDLLKTKLSVLDDEACKERWNTSELLLPHGIDVALSLCAIDTGIETCSGESGAPLVTYSSSEYYCMYDVVGIASLGKLCRSMHPDIYTRVSNYVPWIESVVWPQG